MRTSLIYVFVFLAFVAAVIFGGMKLSDHLKNVSDRQAKEQVLESARAVAEARAAALETQLKVALEAAASSEKRAVAAETKLATRPRPAPPSPPPATNEDLGKGLVAAGIQPGLAISPVATSSIMTVKDGKQVWAWEQQSLRVPALEARLGAVEEAWKARSDQAESLQKAVVSSTEELHAEVQEHAVDKALVRNLQKQVKADEKRSTFEKVGYAAGGILLGALVGRATR